MKKLLPISSHNHLFTPERILIFACLLIQGVFLFPLMKGETILAHDNFYWNFPIFHYTAVTLMKGSLPLWDPFSNGGQPFYPHLVQFRLLEPLILITILIGKWFTQNTVILFNVSKTLQLWLVCAGAYLCLKRYTKHQVTRLFLIPVLFLSSFFLVAFHQDGILSQFLWIPWILHFLIALFFEHDFRWFRFLLLGVFIGLSWQSYQFVGTWTFLFFFFLPLIGYYRTQALQVWKTRGNKKKFCFSLILILLMMAPNIVLISESGRFVFPLRTAPKDFKERLMKDTGLLPTEVEPGDIEIGIRMPYEMIPYTGAMVKVWELIQTFSPNANPNIFSFRTANTWGSPSEAYIYLGLFTWALCLLGLTTATSPHKKLWLLLTLGFGLLMLGPPGGLHRLLFYLFPPLWFIRHTTLFVLFFVFGCLYFFVLGLEKIQEKDFSLSLTTNKIATIAPFTLVLFTFGVLATELEYPVFKFPETNFVFVIFIILGLAAWRVLSILGKEGLWLSLVVAQMTLVLFLSKDKVGSALYFLFFLFFPFLLAWLAHKQKKVRTFLWNSLLILVILDLGFSFWSAGRLYTSQESPEKLFQLPMMPTTLTETPRQIYPIYPSSLYGRQAPRYLSLLHQRPFVLSGILFFKGSENLPPLEDMASALASKRWNSYLLSKNYFNLIHSELSPEILSKLFLVGERALQFRTKGVSETTFLSLAKQGVGEKTLQNAVVVNELIPKTNEQANASPFSPSKIKTEQYSYNGWIGTVETTTDGFFLYGDGYDPHWTVTVDGEEEPLLRLNFNSKGVYLKAGTHRVEFKYRAWPFLISVALFLSIPVLIVIFLLAVFFQQKQKFLPKTLNSEISAQRAYHITTDQDFSIPL